MAATIPRKKMMNDVGYYSEFSTPSKVSLQQKLSNIQTVIAATRKTLESINEAFSNHQRPPSIYIKEYESLTDKIHKYQLQEQQLLDQMGQDLVDSPVLTERAQSYNAEKDNMSLASSVSSSSPTTKTFPNPLIKVYLPLNMTTTIRAVQGKTLKEGLMKPMQLRGFHADGCQVFRDKSRSILLSWSTELGQLAGQEVYLDIKEVDDNSRVRLPYKDIFAHNYVKKTHFTLTYCDVCHNLMFQSLQCQACGHKRHAKCEEGFTCQDALVKYLSTVKNPHMFPDINSAPIKKKQDRESLYSFVEPNSLQRKRSPSVPDFNLTIQNEELSTKNDIMRSNNSLSSNDSNALAVKQRYVERDSIGDWEIPNMNIVYECKIGSGSFGTVYKAHWHGPVAVKKLNFTDPTPSQIQAFKNEVCVLRKTRHNNILLFMGLMTTPYLAIVTQWCDGDSLYTHLHVKETKFQMFQLIMIGKQIAQGMDYLHAKSIIHRDLKSNNIFLTEIFQENMTVKIGDFGLATVNNMQETTDMSQQPTGTILWMAPEIIRMNVPNPYTFQSDVFAFGIVVFELVTGTLPYAKINNREQLLFMIGKGYLKPDISLCRNDTPKQVKILMLSCTSFNRDERPLFPNVLSTLQNLYSCIPKIKRSMSEPAVLSSESSEFQCDIAYNTAT
ncbi:serine/threonine-protein kinase A-Raf-like [Physella acuta]|uniref:serine/threonine-protein kinase A-Raf-like n=1 Tax=Physella acuta TaxID=109671 RepID=UPI0027DC5EDC|nr:serine/threonine-protein kinase A-Raf-like [Physella acuta]XP_059143175.1 serine/threonine-protein kinase A-Raf-like [Physella acuta]XP_059143176.1 serine/threonine-protein kinase A-Raf-like [Physella acuta]